MRRFLTLVSSLLATQAFALEGTVKPNLFYNAAGKPELEIHMVVNSKTIQFKKNSAQKWQAGLTAVVTVTHNGAATSEQFKITSPGFASQEETTRYNIADILTLSTLPAGNSEVKFKVFETADSTNTFSQEFSIDVNDPTAKGGFSDIFFAELLEKSDPGNRQGYGYVPYPFDFFAEGMDNIRFYTELYVPQALQQDAIKVSYGISKKRGQAFYKTYEHHITLPGGHFATPIAENLAIDSLPSGNYYLTLYAYHNETLLDSASIFFQRINTAIQSRNPEQQAAEAAEAAASTTIVNVDTSFVGKFTPAQLDKCLRMLIPVVRGADMQVINTLMASDNLEQKKRYIYNHWADKNPTNPKKAFDEYIKLVNFLQKEYGTSFKPGFETDRGLVFLRYGKPNQVIKVEREMSAYPYEIWQYDALESPRMSNAVFLFYKPPHAIGELLLLHSNVRGERRDPDWRTKLFQNQSNTSSPVNPYGSRADEYFK